MANQRTCWNEVSTHFKWYDLKQPVAFSTAKQFDEFVHKRYGHFIDNVYDQLATPSKWTEYGGFARTSWRLTLSNKARISKQLCQELDYSTNL